MITVLDVLSGKEKKKELWAIKCPGDSLVDSYKLLRNTLQDWKCLRLNYCQFKSIFDGRVFETSRNMAIMYQNKKIIKALDNKNYIYLTPTRLHIPQSVLPVSRNDDEYVGILKWPGLIGYSILILGFGTRSYGFTDPEYEEYDNHCGLMEVLSDGTIILFERTVPWDKVKACRSNSNSIRNLFFTEDEIRLIGLKINQIMSSPESKPGMVCKTYIDEDLYDNQKDVPF